MSLSQYNVYQQLTSARVATTANLAGVYSNGPLNNGLDATLTASAVAALTIDGVSVVAGDRVLLNAQNNANENGVYVVVAAGSAVSLWQLQRSGDQQSVEQLKGGQYIPVSAGTVNSGSLWVLIEPIPSRLGIDDLTFSPASVPAGGTYLVTANNLSDVASVATARQNLGLGIGNSPTFVGVTTSGYFYSSAANALTAHAGGGQGSALQLAKGINRVTTVGTAGDSVKLPAATAGQQVVVINAAASNAMDVFPATGEAINALGANTALSVAADKTVIFYCALTGQWNSIVTA